MCTRGCWENRTTWWPPLDLLPSTNEHFLPIHRTARSRFHGTERGLAGSMERNRPFDISQCRSRSQTGLRAIHPAPRRGQPRCRPVSLLGDTTVSPKPWPWVNASRGKAGITTPPQLHFPPNKGWMASLQFPLPTGSRSGSMNLELSHIIL